MTYLHTSDQAKLNLGFYDCSCNWGVHICGLYETEAERDEVILGFLHAGDLAGDMQLYCPAERSRENFLQVYGRSYPGEQDHPNDPKRFSISSPKELYYPDGTFSPWVMDDNLNAFFAESQKNGPVNIRATAEMVWALDAIQGVEHLMAYESRLNYFIPNKPWISICMYNVNKFSGATIMQVLQTHPYTINGGVITENPYYIDPDSWLKDNAPEFLSR